MSQQNYTKMYKEVYNDKYTLCDHKTRKYKRSFKDLPMCVRYNTGKGNSSINLFQCHPIMCE